jgi:hypothetical protein
LDRNKKSCAAVTSAFSLSQANTDVAKAKKAILQKKRTIGPDSSQRTVSRQSIGLFKVPGKFFSALESLQDRSSFLDYLAPSREAEWVVYAKRPFAGPEQVLDYVGRYTHRVAISNHRLLDIAEGQVTFRYKDYRHDAQQKTMILQAEEFISPCTVRRSGPAPAKIPSAVLPFAPSVPLW